MDRAGLFVDAGYLLAAGGNLTVGACGREQLDVSVKGLVNSLMRLVEEDAGLPLLRTYWYDACKRDAALTSEQKDVKDVPFVKLRVGTLSSRGVQKRVDSLIFRDLTTLSRERAICSAYLVAGDADMVEAVAMSQEMGVQVTLVSVIPAGNSGVARDLIDEVDREMSLEEEFLSPFFARRQQVSPKKASESDRPLETAVIRN